MKKILLLTPMLHQGGFERVCVETARLLETEYDVTIAVFNLEDLAFNIDGLKVIDLKLPVRDSKIGKILNVFKRARALSKLCREENIDVVYSFGITANRVLALSSGSVKKIMACHSFEEVKDSKYMKLLDRYGDSIICCSKKMTQMSENLHGIKGIVTLWNPFDTAKILKQAEEPIPESDNFNNQSKPSGPRLVTMGREDDVKGYWHLIKTFIRIHEKYETATLTLVGDGTFEDLKQMAAEANVANSIAFTGHKMNPFPYVKNSDIYVLSSISEGLPMALVEAMSLGLPVVSTNCLSGPAEILAEDFEAVEKQKGIFEADYGILTGPFTWDKDVTIQRNDDGTIILTPEEEDLANAILKLWEHKELYTKYSNAGPQRAVAFSKENYLSGLKTLL